MSVEVGQEVWLYDVNDQRYGRREPCRGTVVKVGRKLATIRYGAGYDKVFRLDTTRSNDNYGHQWFKTDEQATEDDRRSAATEVLRAARLRPESGCSLSLVQLEAIAAVISGGSDER